MKICLTALLASVLLTGCANAPSTASAGGQPGDPRLSYQAIVNHFNETGMQQAVVQTRCTVFSEGVWASAAHYDYCLIVVENSDEDVQVTFYLTDAHEMNWITEFLDSPFFTRAEMEKLFGMVSAEREVRAAPVGRYRVDFHHWQPRHAQIFVFSFTGIGSGGE